MTDAISPALLSQLDLAEYLSALECPFVYVSPLKDIEITKSRARSAITGHIAALEAKLAEAREQERERCAKIAEDGWADGFAAKHIAAAIRKGGDGP